MASLSFTDSLLTPDFDKNLLLQSNYIASSIILSYILFTKVVGPRIMKNREPMELKSLILFYNLFLVVGNVCVAYLVSKLTVEMWPYRCNIKESPIHLLPKQFLHLGWAVIFIKYLELLDTVFFVLRKKFNQVSFLHVFHHTIVCIMTWLSLKYKLIGYYMLMIVSINFSVHVLLYTYYGLSALGPGMRKYLWWKKYLTTIQIMQFLVILFYMSFSFLIDCEEYGDYDLTVLLLTVTVTVLFLNFYFKTYKKQKPT